MFSMFKDVFAETKAADKWVITLKPTELTIQSTGTGGTTGGATTSEATGGATTQEKQPAVQQQEKQPAEKQLEEQLVLQLLQ
ncbi:hypothetical protein ABWK22_17975 [Gottfriedia acidiceleris]|uniref:hypothetical protein n=1 Tax=Gottfriedia acidiceleris TaxID=371036 RepID=UPI003395ABEC